MVRHLIISNKNREELIYQPLKFASRPKLCKTEWKILLSAIAFVRTFTLRVHACARVCMWWVMGIMDQIVTKHLMLKITGTLTILISVLLD